MKNKNSLFIIHNSRFNFGQLLVEALIGIGVGALLTLAIIPASNFLTQTKNLDKKLQAQGLAQEGKEAIESIADSNYSFLYKLTRDIPYYLNKSPSGWTLTSDMADKNTMLDGQDFSREIFISSLSRSGQNGQGDIVATGGYEDPSTLKIIAKVSAQQELAKLIFFISRNKNALWSQTNWSGGAGQDNWLDPSRFSSATNMDWQTTLGSLVLAKQTGVGSKIYGNQFLVDSTVSLGTLSASTYKQSMRFTSLTSQKVKAVYIYIQARRSPPTYRVGLQADNAGNPGGTFLGPTQRGYGDISPPALGWQKINLLEPVDLQAGSIYHLVVQYRSGSISGSRNISLRGTLPDNNLYPYDCSTDSASDTLWFNGTRWSVQSRQPLFLLENETTTYGNPYETGETRNIFGTNFYGQGFNISGDVTVKDISFYINRTNQQPADSLYIVLYNQTDNQTIEEGTLALPSQVTTTYSYRTYTFTTPRVLSAGKTYYIYLKSPNSRSTRYYQVKVDTAPNQPWAIPPTFDKDTSYFVYSANSGTNWTTETFRDLAGFKMTQEVLTGGNYFPNGELISSIFDTGNPSGFNTLSFTGNPNGGKILWQLASSDNSTGPWQYWGPDGTTSSSYSLSPSYIFTGSTFYNKRYLRYKLRLETPDQTKSPQVDEIIINYSP